MDQELTFLRSFQIVAVLSACFLAFSAMLASGQIGFLSIDCGATESYTDDNGIHWLPDDDYIQTGENVVLELDVSDLYAHRHYPDDPFDRVWFPFNENNTFLIGLVSIENHSPVVTNNTMNQPPSAVMQTALKPIYPFNTIGISFDRLSKKCNRFNLRYYVFRRTGIVGFYRKKSIRYSDECKQVAWPGECQVSEWEWSMRPTDCNLMRSVGRIDRRAPSMDAPVGVPTRPLFSAHRPAGGSTARPPLPGD
eukprot:Gb_41448 [translate_table: standard]